MLALSVSMGKILIIHCTVLKNYSSKSTCMLNVLLENVLISVLITTFPVNTGHKEDVFMSFFFTMRCLHGAILLLG